MIPVDQAEVAVSSYRRSKVAALRVVGDFMPTPYVALATARQQESAGSWWGARHARTLPMTRVKFEEGVAGFFATDQVFAGL